MSEPPHDLPATAPEMESFADLRSSEFLPFALYSLVDIPHAEVASLAKSLEGDAVIGKGDDAIHLVIASEESMTRQQSLGGALDYHIQWCKDHKEKIQAAAHEESAVGYLPYGFLAVHDKDWDAKGVSLVYADFEDPFTVTGFRLKIADVKGCCAPLRDGDVTAEEMRENYGIE